MSSNRHEKPSAPFGYIAFSKDGKVDVSLSNLTKIKDDQEAEVAQRFAQQLTRHFGWSVFELSRLEERAHDASMLINGQSVVLQITEIWQKGFELPAGSPDPGNPKSIGYFSAGSSTAIQLDTNKMNDSIRRAIQKKLAKRYAPDRDATTWLLIFTASPLILTEVSREGKLVIEEPLLRAREFVAARSLEPFSEIWSMNLLTRPVRIWPPTDV